MINEIKDMSRQEPQSLSRSSSRFKTKCPPKTRQAKSHKILSLYLLIKKNHQLYYRRRYAGHPQAESCQQPTNVHLRQELAAGLRGS